MTAKELADALGGVSPKTAMRHLQKSALFWRDICVEWRMMKLKNSERKKCSVCGGLGKIESGFYKFGWEEDSVPLPSNVDSLREIACHDSVGRGDTLYQCPECLCYFHYNLDYEFLVNGSEDTETLMRISDEEAEQLRQKIERKK